MDLGRLGILSDNLGLLSDADATTVAMELEDSGWDTVWLPPWRGHLIRDNALRFLSRTHRLNVAVGAYANGADFPPDLGRLGEAYDRRLLVHLDVEHDRTAHDLVVALDALDRAPQPVGPDRRLLTGSGPSVTRLAQQRALGVRPDLVTPAGIAVLRAQLGDLPLIACQVPVIPFVHAETARHAARPFLASALARRDCAHALRDVGYTERDFCRGGSDRLIDDVVAWGGPADITERVAQFVESGADHIVLRILPCGGSRHAEWRALAELAG